MSFVCTYVIHMSLVCTCMSLVCHLYVTHMYSHVIHMSLICTCMSSGCNSRTRMSSVCHLYVTCMPSVCHSYVLVFHPYVTCMYLYIIRVSLACAFTMNTGSSYQPFHLWKVKHKNSITSSF